MTGSKSEKNSHLIYSYIICLILGSLIVMLTVLQPGFPRPEYIESITLEQEEGLIAFDIMIISFGITGLLLFNLSIFNLILNVFYDSSLERILRFALTFLFGFCAMCGSVFYLVLLFLIPSELLVNLFGFIFDSPLPSGTAMVIGVLSIICAFMMVVYYQKIFRTLYPNKRKL